MSVPGVNVIVAATFLAAIGDIHRFKNPRKLVGYLGLDPRVRQSGAGPATHGHISKQGSVRARHALVEACWTDGRASPGRCTRSTSASVRAAVTRSRSSPPRASSRACSGACSPAKRTTPTHQPSLTKKKLRRLRDHRRRAERYAPEAAGIWHANDAVREAERELARQAEVAYARTVRDWHAAQAKQGGRERDTGARIKQALEGQSRAADHKPLTSALRYVSHSRPAQTIPHNRRYYKPAPARQRRPRAGENPVNGARRATIRAIRSHRSRSAALRGESATDPIAEIVAKCDRNKTPAPLIFIRRPLH